MDFLFPHDEPRKIQKGFIRQVYAVLKNKGQLLVHAPTGIGKTASALSPALSYVLKEDKKKVILFLTARHTQHLIAIETLKKIKKKYDVPFVTVDLVGKKTMCNQDGVQLLGSSEFTEYCKDVREKGRCDFYNKLKIKNKASPAMVNTLEKLKRESPMHVEDVKDVCHERGLCSYEVATSLAKDAQVIVGDYNYVLNPFIRDNLLKRINKNVDDLIIIFDEGHNVPQRARDLLTASLGYYVLDNAIKEARVQGFSEMSDDLIAIKDILISLGKSKLGGATNEIKITKKDFHGLVEKLGNYEELMGNFSFIGDQVLEKKRKSFCLNVATFMEHWIGPDDGFVRIITKSFSKRGNVIYTLTYRCLDPAIVMKDLIGKAHAVIVMSGTLTPIDMYSNLLGLDQEKVVEVEYGNPFPKENKLSLIVPGTSTKFTSRNEAMYKEIAMRCSSIVNTVPGNSVIFFPSYFLRDKIYESLRDAVSKTIFLEDTKYTKQERGDLLERFKRYKDDGAVLLGVAGGSFAEGVDLPGDLLKCVIVVGLPLGRPDLETKELIAYYDTRFGRGWDYGYVFPAVIKILQSAGRCIRSETDRGVVVFLDDRYTWQSYKRCFPSDMDLKVKREPEEVVKAFFNKKF
jgi:DNA excision repair protein ERCC-2